MMMMILKKGNWVVCLGEGGREEGEGRGDGPTEYGMDS